MNLPAIYCGDFSIERTVLLAIVPQESLEGGQVRAIHVLSGEDVSPDPQNYWLMQVGRLHGGSFQLRAQEQSFAGGFSAGVVKRIAFEDPILVSRGENLAVRLTPRGDAAPITGLSLALEWGIISTRRSAHV